MNCPRCNTPLAPQQAGRLQMNCCYSCGGLFLDGGAARRVVEVVDPGAMATAQQVSQSAQRPVQTEGVAPCPVCARPLDRMPIPAANVVVDACAQHGVWFDRDELQRVVQAVGPQAAQAQQPMPQQPMQQQPMQPIPGAPMQPYQPPQQQYQAPNAQLSPGMAPGQYVAPGWMDDSAQKPFGGGMPFGGGGQQQPGMMQPGMPGQPQQPGGQGWGLGKTALAVGGGLAAVAGVAYVASHTNMGQQAMGTHQSGFGAVGDVLSKLF